MKLVSEYTSNDMLKIIQQRGHFEIRLIPNSVNKLEFNDLEKIIKEKQIKHNWVFYPHIPNHDFGRFQRIDNYIESFHYWGDAADMWRFYKSGQFEQYRGFIEDRCNSNPPLTEQWEPHMDRPAPENTFFEPIVKMWEMTEMFLFASKLANELKCELTFEIKLHKMKDRKLENHTKDRFGLFDDYTCNTDTVTLDSFSTSFKELQRIHDKLAEDKIIEIFSHFNLESEYIRSTIKHEQENYYSHNF